VLSATVTQSKSASSSRLFTAFESSPLLENNSESLNGPNRNPSRLLPSNGSSNTLSRRAVLGPRRWFQSRFVL
jgi:hypothetical protein